MNKRISIFVASAFEEKKNTKSNQVISKNVFLYKQHTHTHTTKYEYYTEFFRRACSSANRKKRDKYQTRIVFLYNPHYPPYYYYHYYNYY